MKRQDLIDAIAKEFELPKSTSDNIIKYFLESIKNSLVKNKPVSFIGFGSFSIRKRAARKGRNPQTGESIKIAARKVIHFAAGKALKQAVNKK